MRIIIKYLKPFWKKVLLIALLLLVMALCDLALPQYTSEIIDVGITNHGVDHIVPEKILAEDFRTALIFMNEKEASIWKELYPEAEGQSPAPDAVLTRADRTEKELDAADEALQVPVLMNYMFTSGEASQFFASGNDAAAGITGAAGTGDGAEAAGTGDGAAAAMAKLPSSITPDALQNLLPQYRSGVETLMDTMGPSLLSSMGAAYAAGCDERAGMDINAVQMSYMWRTGGKMFLITLLMLITPILIGYMASGVAASMGRDLRRTVFHRVISFSSSEINRFSTASLITRSTNDIQQIQIVVVVMLRLLLYAPILGLGGIYKVLQTKARMEWIIILGILGIMGLVAVLMRIALPKFRAMQRLIDNLNLVSREILTGLPVIRAFGREQEEEERFAAANRELTGTQLFTSRTMVVMMPGMSIIMYGMTLLIVWVAAGRIDQGNLQIGTMTAFITYAMMIVMSFLMLTAMSIMLPRAGVAAERIDEVINTESSIRDPEEGKRRTIIDGQGTVTFHDVSFGYPDARENVLSGISFTARPGETTAIIGSTGSGKSTLINLIPRFYDVSGGSITVDGVDVRDMELKDLRDRIGFIPQKGVLFSGTIASNLRFGLEDAGEEELRSAAEISQALEFIDARPEGFDAPIAQGGTNVSGGQKQRLAIARAIIRKPDIMIFDDSFSALDMKTDSALRRALRENLKDSTVLIVAQRISTILNADQIIVLENGKIAGMGRHEELVSTCRVYREIAMSQMSLSELGLEGEV